MSTKIQIMTISTITVGAITVVYFIYRLFRPNKKKTSSKNNTPKKSKNNFQIESIGTADKNNKKITREAELYFSSKATLTNQKTYKNKEDSLDKSSYNKKEFKTEHKSSSSTNLKFMNVKDNSPTRPLANPHNKISALNLKKDVYSDNNINTTLLQLVNDIKDPNKSTINQFNQVQDQCGSMFLPDNQLDLDEELRLAEAGYMEEDDEDLKSSEISGGFFGLNDEENKMFNKRGKINSDDDDLINKLNKSINEEQKIVIFTKDALESILFPKGNYTVNPNQTYSIQVIKSFKDNEIINPEMFIVILKFLYIELHNGLIELGDNFTEERRKYFNSNFDVYLSIINYFLKSKEEFFLGVLSQVISKLSINQLLLDNTFNYYLNEAIEDDNVKEIKSCYERVYKAGEKYSIAPKILTKLRLKNILIFQIEVFNNFSSTNPDLSHEVLEIIVTDKTYAEFGFDKDAIRSAINKHQVESDEDFENIFERLNEFKSNSFLFV